MSAEIGLSGHGDGKRNRTERWTPGQAANLIEIGGLGMSWQTMAASLNRLYHTHRTADKCKHKYNSVIKRRRDAKARDRRRMEGGK